MKYGTGRYNEVTLQGSDVGLSVGSRRRKESASISALSPISRVLDSGVSTGCALLPILTVSSG